MRRIEARFIDFETNRIVFPPIKTKGKKHRRVVYLTAKSKEVLVGPADTHPTGPVLLNSTGKPWTKDAINRAFCRLQFALVRREDRGGRA